MVLDDFIFNSTPLKIEPFYNQGVVPCFNIFWSLLVENLVVSFKVVLNCVKIYCASTWVVQSQKENFSDGGDQ